MTSKILSFLSITSLCQSYHHSQQSIFFYFAFKSIPFQWHNAIVTWIALLMRIIKITPCQSWFYSWIHCANFFVPVLKTLAWTLNYSIVGSTVYSVYYPQETWYLEFCVELSFSVLYPCNILPQKTYLQ